MHYISTLLERFRHLREIPKESIEEINRIRERQSAIENRLDLMEKDIMEIKVKLSAST